MTEKDIRNQKRRIMKFRECAAPPADDHEATVRWLRDREVIKNLYRRYAYGVDSIDFVLVRQPDGRGSPASVEGRLRTWRIGEADSDRTTVSGLWPSDHAGLSVELTIAPGLVSSGPGS